MGSIGKRLPKVMWPVFEFSILELQVRFARSLGYHDIFINLHHQSVEILSRATGAAFAGVQWLKEVPEILDIGGGIHNVARHVGYTGELLVLNADQFLWFTGEELTHWVNQAGDWDCLLLNWKVNSSQGYNQVKVSPGRRFEGVVPNAQLPRDTAIETYSGNSLIRLDRLSPQDGPSSFFQSVAPVSKQVMTACLEQRTYWDFGTATRYHQSMSGIVKHLAENREDELIRFMLSQSGIKKEKLRPNTLSYGCSTPGLIHLGSGIPAADHPPGVVLSGPACATGQTPVLVFDSEVQPLG